MASLRTLFMGSFLAGFMSSAPLTVQQAYLAAMVYTAALLLHLLACAWLAAARGQGWAGTWLSNVGDVDLSGAGKPR